MNLITLPCTKVTFRPEKSWPISNLSTRQEREGKQPSVNSGKTPRGLFLSQLRLQPKSLRLLRDRLASLSVLLLLHRVRSSLEHERDCDKDTLTAILLPLETGSDFISG